MQHIEVNAKTGEVTIVDFTKEEVAAWEAAANAEKKQMRAAEIRARLNEIDLQSVRALRAVARGEAAQADTQKLDALETEAANLRAELAAMGTA